MPEVYDSVNGVEVSVWSKDSEPGFPDDSFSAEIEEMYYEECSGNIVLTFERRDSDGFYDITLPVKATDDWNEFVESLPTWNL